MYFIATILSILISLNAPSQFYCDGDLLELTIRNNVNGDFAVTNDLEDIDEGAFIVLKWRESNLMLPRTFNFGEISFTDRKWWFSFIDNEKGLYLNNPLFKKLLPNGKIVEYSCHSDLK